MAKNKEKIQWKNQLVNLIAIIIGVYVAFYLTERSANANSRQQAQTYLSSMVDDLEVDIASLSIATDTLASFLKVSRMLTNSILSQRIPEDSVQMMINSLYLIVPFTPQDNSYQLLKTSGKFDAISDLDLRRKITELYYQHYGAIKVADDLTNQQRTVIILPYLMKNIRYSSTGLHNAEALWKDNMFANLAFSNQFALLMKYQLDSAALVKAKELHAGLLTALKK